MCCFVDDDGSGGGGGCANDPRKTCAAYAGCQSLVISEEDAIIYDANGVDVFRVDDDADHADDWGGHDNVTTTTTGNVWSHQSTSEEEEQSSSEGGGDSTNPYGANATLASDMQLVQRIIFSVCSTANLHTQHGILECASICNPSMCCFDKYEILSLNPKLEIVLMMEGIDDTILDTSEMGKCMHAGGGNETTTTMRGHFCQAHIGCKNIFLFGSPSAAHLTHIFADDFGVYEKDDQSASDVSAASEQHHTLTTVFIMFGIIIGVTIYLLIYEREYAPLKGVRLPSSRTPFDNTDDARSSHRPNEELVTFV